MTAYAGCDDHALVPSYSQGTFVGCPPKTDFEYPPVVGCPSVGADPTVDPEGHSYGEVAARAVNSVHAQHQSPFYGYVRSGVHQKIYLFPLLEDAKRWFHSHTQIEGPHDYAAVFTADDLRGPISGMEHFNTPPIYMGPDQAQALIGQWYDLQNTQVGQSWLLPVLGIPLGALGGYYYGKWRDRNPGKLIPFIGEDVEVGRWGGHAGAQVGGPWHEMVGASDPEAVALIQKAAREVSAFIAANAQKAQGLPFLVWTLDAMPAGTYAPSDLVGPPTFLPARLESHLVGFADAAEAKAFMLGRQNPTAPPWLAPGAAAPAKTAASALFDRTSSHWPNPVNWHKSTTPEDASAITQYLARPDRPAVGQWLDLVGADASQQQSMALIQRAIQETSAAYNEDLAELQRMSAADREEARRQGHSLDPSKVAYVWLLDTSQHERGPGWIISDVHRRDSRDEALQHMRLLNQHGDVDPQGRPVKYAALALFDKASSQWPNPVNWTKSDDPAQAVLIDRYLATPSRFSVGGPWMDLVGAQAQQQADIVRRAEWPQTQALIKAAIEEVVQNDAQQPSPYWLWFLTPPGPTTSSTVVLGPQTMVVPFSAQQEALSYLREVVQSARPLAAAMFDKSSRWPNPVAWQKSSDPAASQLIAQHVASLPTTVSGAWMDLVGAQAQQQADVVRRAEWPQTRALIQSAIDEVREIAASQPSEAYVWTLDDPGPSTRPGVILEPTTIIVPFSTRDAALAYLREVAQQQPIAQAMFERSSPHWPNPTAWRKSSDPADAPMIAQHIARRSSTQMSGTYLGASPMDLALASVRKRAQQLADRRAGVVVGVIHTLKDGLWHTLAFRNEDDADDWIEIAAQSPETYTYAAYFNKNAPQWPVAIIEKISGGRPPPGTGLPRRSANVGQSLDDNRARGKQLASAKRANAVGAIRAEDGLWHVYGLTSLDDAIDWLQLLTREKSRFIYAAAYDKARDGTAVIQDEEFGTARSLPVVSGWAA